MSDKLTEVMGRLAMAGSFAVTPVLKDLPSKDLSSSIINPPPIVEKAPQIISISDKTCFTPFSEPAPFAAEFDGSITGICWAVGTFDTGTLSVWKTDGATLVTLYDPKTNKVTMIPPESYHIDENKNVTVTAPNGEDISGQLNYVSPELRNTPQTEKENDKEKPSIFEKLKSLFVKPKELKQPDGTIAKQGGTMTVDTVTYHWQPLDPYGKNFKLTMEFLDVPSRTITVQTTPDGLIPIQAPVLYLDPSNQKLIMGEIEKSLSTPYSAAESMQEARQEERIEIPWLPESIQVWAPIIKYEAERKKVDPDLAAIIMLIESAGNPDAVSIANAQGLMQIMPGTRVLIANNLLKEPVPTDEEIFDPATNIEYGVALLADNLKRLGVANDPDYIESVVRAASAYNGGDGQATAYSENPDSMLTETRAYAYWVEGAWRERHDASSPRIEEWYQKQGGIDNPESLVGKAMLNLEDSKRYVENWQKNH